MFRYAAFNEEEQEYKVEESFVEYVDFSKKTGEEIANIIQNFLSDNSTPLDDCRGQGYDNGANMAGKNKGVKAHLLENNSLAIFSPCACHTLNLVGVDSAQSCDEVKLFFGYVQNCIIYSPKAQPGGKSFLNAQVHHFMQHRQLVGLQE